MCQQLMILVERGERQFIGQCEHGTIHLAWGLALLHLRPTDVAELTEQLTRCLDRGDFGAMQGGRFRVFSTVQGTFQLWLGTVGLYLTRGELTVFAQMLEEAAQMVSAALRQPWRAGLSDEFQVMHVRAGGSFVCN